MEEGSCIIWEEGGEEEIIFAALFLEVLRLCLWGGGYIA